VTRHFEDVEALRYPAAIMSAFSSSPPWPADRATDWRAMRKCARFHDTSGPTCVKEYTAQSAVLRASRASTPGYTAAKPAASGPAPGPTAGGDKPLFCYCRRLTVLENRKEPPESAKRNKTRGEMSRNTV
jgi:hypothetical protein